MGHPVLIFWAASHVWALLSGSQPLLLTVLGMLLLTTSAATRVMGGGAGAQQSKRGKQLRNPSLSRTSGSLAIGVVPESVRQLTQKAAAREQASAEGMYRHV